MDSISVASDEVETHHKGVVVLAEDDKYSRMALECALEDAGYLVLSARDGLEAAARMSALWLPTVAVLDLQMPRMDGWELIARMRSDELLHHVAIVVTTADPVTHIDGVTTILHKPCEIPEVLLAVQEALGRDRRHVTKTTVRDS